MVVRIPILLHRTLLLGGWKVVRFAIFVLSPLLLLRHSLPQRDGKFQKLKFPLVPLERLVIYC